MSSSEPLCPQCGVNPPRRRPSKYNGRTLCVACQQANRKANWRLQAERRTLLAAARLGRVGRPLVCPRCQVNPPRFPPKTIAARVPMCHACYATPRCIREYRSRDDSSRDIPAAEIERRYQLALSQIRRRSWTLAQSSLRGAPTGGG